MPIDGVILTPLKIIPDDRGQVMHMLRSDAPHFKQFGEMYFSCVYPGVTKGWKVHSTCWGNLAAPVGRLKIVLHDLREESPTKGQFQEVFLGETSYQLLTVPPGVAYAWKNLLPEMAVLANCATEPWTAGEGKNLPFEEIAYKW
jgi:dTDP-4-dehydrorhamnose 3,5-epimerase